MAKKSFEEWLKDLFRSAPQNRISVYVGSANAGKYLKQVSEKEKVNE